MSNTLLEEILLCEKLPSMPGVAMRVIELTGDENVSMRELASTIEADQGLSSRFLKTVNSSFFGLGRTCSTISQAQLVLGLNGVRTLALGFSLVGCVGQGEDDGFDYEGYWRRAVYTAVGARLIAVRAKQKASEEAFLCGLLQDLGMIAMHRALGERYAGILMKAGSEHHSLGSIERVELDLHHAEVGAELAERWMLPDSLVGPIRFHEKPTAAPTDHAPIAKCVWLGQLVAEALTHEDTEVKWLTEYREKSREWFGIEQQDADGMLEEIRDGATEMAALMSVSIGARPDVSEILTRANERLVDMSLAHGLKRESAVRHRDALEQELHLDTQTGVASRSRCHEMLEVAFERAQNGSALSLLIVDPDGLRRINNEQGWDAGDQVLKTLAARLNAHFRPYRGLVGRLGGEQFGVVLDQVDRETAWGLIQAFCEMLVKNPLGSETGASRLDEHQLTVSAGLATFDSDTVCEIERVEQLVNAADQALHAAKAAGGNCVRTDKPRKVAA